MRTLIYTVSALVCLVAFGPVAGAADSTRIVAGGIMMPAGAILISCSNGEDIVSAPGTLSGDTVLGEIVGKRAFIFRRSGGEVWIMCYQAGRLLFRAKDPAIDLGKGGTIGPGVTYKGYEFYLSPSGRYLFVDRGIGTGTEVGYLFKSCGPHSMCLVQPSGLRFDEAALRFFARSRKVKNVDFGQYDRIARFEKWVNDAPVISMYVASFSGHTPWSKRDVAFEWLCKYDPKSGDFTISDVKSDL